ncbi:MAG TPA: peptide chain release factor N(5)-glutamine methyltransferase [Bacteroidales bacterium]|nr:peptide chain release factor N(5)-glutamine methyltransferase [Bacteroidales bacterium]HPS17914.1 peptide chain release factor N(5)-glutamine methyltransferase [Bacteroidales bacterium]
MKIKEAINRIDASLKNIYDEREARSIAYLVVEHLLNIPKEKILSIMEEGISIDNETMILEAMDELVKFKPVQYVTGHTSFYNCRINVNENVLIPRSETEELVDLIINGNNIIDKPIKILDIGTGSGCIAIALKKNISSSEVYATDISKAALCIAKENALNNKVEINFYHSDILDKSTWGDAREYDVIVSNPPYVRESEKKLMSKNVLDYEPSLALFVPDDSALIYYKSIADFSLIKLKPEGKLYFEINEALPDETSKMLQSKGFEEIVIRNDINGKPRFIICKKP